MEGNHPVCSEDVYEVGNRQPIKQPVRTCVATGSSPPPPCAPIGPFRPGPKGDSGGPGSVAVRPRAPSAPRTDTHPWPDDNTHTHVRY